MEEGMAAIGKRVLGHQKTEHLIQTYAIIKE